MSTPLLNRRILIVDDNAAIHDDFRKILQPPLVPKALLEQAERVLLGESSPQAESFVFSIDSAFQGQEGLDLVRQAVAAGHPYALAFVDVRMPPGWDGIETVRRLRQEQADLQVVICTAYSDHSWNEISYELGNTDNVVLLKKPFDTVEVLQLAHALTRKWQLNQEAQFRLDNLAHVLVQRTKDLEASNLLLQCEIAEHEVVERALRISEERFAKAFSASPLPLAIQTLQTERFVDVNESFVEMTGYARKEIVSHKTSELELFAEDSHRRQMFAELMDDKLVRQQTCRLRNKSGQLLEVLISLEMFNLGEEPHVLMIAQDITERLNLEHQLRQAQKMEALGQLVAGIAHDFNNILTIIQGHTSMLLDAPSLNEDTAGSMRQVLAASKRAENMIRQLLAFSRKQILQPRILNLNGVLMGTADMLRRLIGEPVELVCELDETLPNVLADSSCVDQILINLAVNARDAMPTGGRLTLRTSTVELDETATASNLEARAGRFVCVAVADTGCGIEPEVLTHIFEPFFTTKDTGKGSGLGLATVYGILKQHEGWIEVSSEVGHGATFRFYLPVYELPAEAASPVPAKVNHHPLRGETILLVEDEDAVRQITSLALRQHGHTVYEARNGVEALAEWDRIADKVGLLITDMVMPNGVSGKSLVESIRSNRPDLKVICISGYSLDLAVNSFSLDHETCFLSKPFDMAQLIQTVAQCLNGEPAEEVKFG